MISQILLDTHSWYWALFEPQKLSLEAAAAFEDADEILVSSVSAYEIGQKIRHNRWPGMDRIRLNAMLGFDGIRISALNARVAALASLIDWPHRDPFDRMIAATALDEGLPLLSKDVAFDQIRNLQRIWS